MTATYTVPKFVIGGEIMTKLIVVDATTGEIKDYDPQMAPAWVDRTLPQDLSKDYANWWGHYHHKDVHWLQSTFYGGVNQTEVADSDLVFNDANQSVYSMPMSSVNNADGSATGLLLYSTRENKAVYYPGMNGIPVGPVVENTFSGTERNVKKYEVKQIQLYAINGELPTLRFTRTIREARAKHLQPSVSCMPSLFRPTTSSTPLAWKKVCNSTRSGSPACLSLWKKSLLKGKSSASVGHCKMARRPLSSKS